MMYRLTNCQYLFFSIFIICSLYSCDPIIDLSIDDLATESTLEDNPQIDDASIVPPPNRISVTYNQIMPLANNSSPHPQGGDCWDGILFQFSSNNNVIRIYSLEEKALIQTYTLNKSDKGFISNCHCNSVCFGSSYYEKGDEFPLLYVSTGYTNGGYSGALVYRVIKTNGQFSFSLVQTIRLPVLKSSWTEFIPAGDYCYVGYTTDSIYYKMLLPSVLDGDVILDCSKEAVEVFQFPPQPEEIKSSRNQGKMFYNEKIIFSSGVPQSGEVSVLFILDLKTRTYQHIFGFREMRLFQEPESVFIWKNKLCVAFVNQIISFDFTPDILTY